MKNKEDFLSAEDIARHGSRTLSVKELELFRGRYYKCDVCGMYASGALGALCQGGNMCGGELRIEITDREYATIMDI